ncbi:hypothetical protein [Methylosinus sp. Ce-a6]|uniref:hypothetical protein n=1 Tax=Methylosinus sp. Ce-a6 TaxID=2172005 RepID=UPI001357688B|nr:hypothetical protein [Methylosinus sp. Ce-a6]
MTFPVKTSPALRAADRELFESLIPGFNATVDGLAGKLEEAGHNLLSDAISFRRQIAGSPYERLVLAGRLLDMCDSEISEMLNREIDDLTFDDVLASIEGLATKVRALKARAEIPKAAE